MRRLACSLFALVVLAGAGACSTADTPLTPRMAPDATAPHARKIPATDSLMMLTSHTFSDTANVLAWTTPLAADVTVSATIGSAGGSLKIDAVGGKIDIPSGALSQATTITMTARAGSAVAYEFGPHGTTFAKPVKIQQDLRLTVAHTDPTLLQGSYGGYFDTALSAAFLDSTQTRVRVKETQIGYLESNGTQLKFYIDHFSGYLVSTGRSRTAESSY
jgi:hypothetical protein